MMRYEIRKKQTTYIDLFDRKEERAGRVRFFRKAEFRLQSREFENLETCTEHPLLMAYRENWVSIFIYGSNVRPEDLHARLSACVISATSGWREFSDFANDQYGTVRLLAEGTGLLFQGPESVGGSVSGVLKDFAVKYSILAHKMKPKTGLKKILLMDRDYVVAGEFDVNWHLPR